MSEIDICVGNYAAYNAGYLVDQWISLPLSDEKLEAKIGAIRKNAQAVTGELAEEMYISDYDGYPMGLADLFCECSGIWMVNLLARQMKANPDKVEIVEACYETGIDQPDSILELMNVLEQAEELPFEAFGDSLVGTPEEKLAERMLEANPELSRMLEEDEALRCAFSHADYGEYFAQYGYVSDEGFYDATLEGPDKGRFDLAYFEEKYASA